MPTPNDWERQARAALAAADRPTRVAIHLAAADMGEAVEAVADRVLVLRDDDDELSRYASEAESFIAAFDALIADHSPERDPEPIDREPRARAVGDCLHAANQLRRELAHAAGLRSDTKARNRVNDAINALESAATLLRDRP